jgi:hypothetical protein
VRPQNFTQEAGIDLPGILDKENKERIQFKNYQVADKSSEAIRSSRQSKSSEGNQVLRRQSSPQQKALKVLFGAFKSSEGIQSPSNMKAEEYSGGKSTEVNFKLRTLKILA